MKDFLGQYFGKFCFFVALLGVLISGERIHSLLFVCSFLLSLLLMYQNFKNYWKSLLIAVGVVSAALALHPRLIVKITNFLSNIMDFSGNYYLTIMGGFEAFKAEPVFGIGTATYRYICPDVVPKESIVFCSNHPHNFYTQILGEVGFVGFILALTFYMSLLVYGIRSWKKNRHSLNWVVGFVVPVAFFFPLQSTGDFFGQWFNVFMWTGLGTTFGIAQLPSRSDSHL